MKAFWGIGRVVWPPSPGILREGGEAPNHSSIWDLRLLLRQRLSKARLPTRGSICEEGLMRGKAWKFGDAISTDHIIPGRYFYLSSNLPALSKHILEYERPDRKSTRL